MKLQIEVDGRTYDVEVVDQEHPAGYVPPRRTHRAQPRTNVTRRRRGAAVENGANECRSPLRGIVARVNVRPGQKVEAEEVMLVLEAMKMETNIAAPAACTVKNVLVAPGDGVVPDQVLLEFE